MKKTAIILALAAVLSLCLASCKSSEGENGLSEEMIAALGEIGMSEEEFASLPAEEQDALRSELGFEVGAIDGGEENDKKPSKKATLSDVDKGGDYVVTVGDGMLWNYYELYYRDGKLWKIVTHFMKSEGEDEEVQVIEGEEAISEFNLFDIDYSGSASTVVSRIKNAVGYDSVYIEHNAE